MSNKPEILLIHGAIVAASSWDGFKGFFEAKGYKVSAPGWPYKDRPAAEQRLDPDPHLGELSLRGIAAHYEKILQAMSEQPVLIGHSFGGLMVQILRSRGYGRAGITLDSAPAEGVFAFYPSVFKGAWPGVRSGILGRRTFTASFEEFSYGFMNGLPEHLRRAAYEAHVVPETSKIFLEAAAKDLPGVHGAAVDFGAHPEIPLLMIGGSRDNLCPERMTHANWRKYLKTGVKADYKVFEGATHWLMAEPGMFENVAAFSEEWIRKTLS